MKILKVVVGLGLLAVLVLAIQLVDGPKNSPATGFQRLADVSLTQVAEAENSLGRSDAALLVLDYVLENNLPDKERAAALRPEIFAQLTRDTTPLGRLHATGWTQTAAGNNSFGSLAGVSVADAALYGGIADLTRQGALDDGDEFLMALNKVTDISSVFPPASGALTLAKAARRAGVFNDPLTAQLRQILMVIQPDPKAAQSVEKFKENFMPIFELARQCRTWTEFATILRQADSPDQVKVLTKMVSTAPGAAKRLSQVLTVAAQEGRATAALSLDHVLRRGQPGLDALHAALGKGVGGLKFAAAHPGFMPSGVVSRQAADSFLERAREKYQAQREQHGAAVLAVKYLVIALCAGLLVLLIVPGRYLEKLPTRAVAEPTPAHHFLSALAIGVVLSGLAYLLSLAVRPGPVESGAVAAASESGSVVAAIRADSALLSGTVVLLSLAIHAVVWFYVRGKVREIEDDAAHDAGLRLKRLENLDVFLDLPLFTGLALTVIAFILITLDAGMSRHFAYTSTVVGILSAVSLRIRYQYPLKERLIQSR